MSEGVKLELLADGALLRLVFERDKGNVLTGQLMKLVDGALAEHANDTHLKLVLLEGAGKHFSFGASVEEHQKDQAAGMLATFHGLIRRIAGYPVPVAAVVRGRCLGGAFEVALACRFVFAEETSVFACPEIKLGVFPPVLAALGPARLGNPWTERLLLTGGELGATTGKSLGFVTETTPAGKDPFELASEWFDGNLKNLSAFAIRQGVDALRRGSESMRAVGETLGRIEAQYVGRLIPSHDGNEGVTAFIEKRQPKWSDA